MSFQNYETVCNLLDKLTLEKLLLTEKLIKTKLELENCMCDGESYLAKSRYIMGQKNVSSLQLPGSESSEFEALAVVNSSQDDFFKSFDLEMKKPNRDDGENSTLKDPMRWFGYLVPQSLHQAQARYRQALHWVVVSANLQMKLDEICSSIQKLYVLKMKLKG